MYRVHCTLYTVHCTLYILHCTLYAVHCTLYTVHCTTYNVHFTLYTVHCTVYSVHCTLYTVHCRAICWRATWAREREMDQSRLHHCRIPTQTTQVLIHSQSLTQVRYSALHTTQVPTHWQIRILSPQGERVFAPKGTMFLFSQSCKSPCSSWSKLFFSLNSKIGKHLCVVTWRSAFPYKKNNKTKNLLRYAKK